MLCPFPSVSFIKIFSNSSFDWALTMSVKIKKIENKLTMLTEHLYLFIIQRLKLVNALGKVIKI